MLSPALREQEEIAVQTKKQKHRQRRRRHPYADRQSKGFATSLGSQGIDPVPMPSPRKRKHSLWEEA